MESRRTMQQVWDKAVRRARRQRAVAPSYRTVRRICHDIPEAVRCLARDGENAYRNRFEPITRFEVAKPNQRWHVDHTRLDIELLDSDCRPKHPWLTSVLDARSRSLMGFRLAFERPWSLTVSLALRMAILPKSKLDWPMCGIPEAVFVDRGKELIGTHMKEVAANLGFELVPSRRGPRHNAKLERHFLTINTGFLCELPGYTGPNVKKRPEQVEATLTLEEFEALFVDWVVMKYHRAVNRTTGQTPIERFGHGFVPRLPRSPRELDLLLVLESKPRRVQRDGVSLFTRTYMSAELAAYIREEVVVRYDPRDLSEVQVYLGDQWIGTARSTDPEHPFCDVQEMRRLQRERRLQVGKELWHYLQGVSGSRRRRSRTARRNDPTTLDSVQGDGDSNLLRWEVDKYPWPYPARR